MEQLALIGLLGALYGKVVDFVKYVRNADWNAAVTQAVVWATGILGTFFAGAQEQIGQVTLPQLETTLSDLSGVVKTLLGAAIASVLSVIVDTQKSIDGSQSAKRPPLVH